VNLLSTLLILVCIGGLLYSGTRLVLEQLRRTRERAERRAEIAQAAARSAVIVQREDAIRGILGLANAAAIDDGDFSRALSEYEARQQHVTRRLNRMRQELHPEQRAVLLHKDASCVFSDY